MTRVLVIEPTPDLGVVLRVGLSAAGHRVLVLPSVAAASSLFRWRPDVVVLGVVPGDDAPRLCALVRRSWPDARLLVLTTSPDPTFSERMQAAGADACLLEPFDPDELAGEVERLLPAAGPARKRVLVVEVEPGLAHLLARVVEWAGYPVEVVVGLAAARARLREEPPPALVLLDVARPTSDALDFCRAARDEAPERPLVLVTPLPRPEVRTEAIEAGCTHVVPNPVDVESLDLVVRIALGDAPDRRRLPRAG